MNAFSVDVEDYFQVSAFDSVVARSEWEEFEPRVNLNTRRLLDLLDRWQMRATFFVLGWVAERWPVLIRKIREGGHELACHGYDHQLVTGFTPDQFRADIQRAKRLIEDITGVEVIGYRAPSYSIVEETLWALEILAEEGFRYDSSIFPIRHDRYGIPDSARFPWSKRCEGGEILHEFPISTVRVLGTNLPFVGGGYLRQLPLSYIRWGMRHVNHVEKRPVVVYVHPWEIDPDQPRIRAGALTTVRHYRNIRKTEARLAVLFEEFRFTAVRDLLGL